MYKLYIYNLILVNDNNTTKLYKVHTYTWTTAAVVRCFAMAHTKQCDGAHKAIVGFVIRQLFTGKIKCVK